MLVVSWLCLWQLCSWCWLSSSSSSCSSGVAAMAVAVASLRQLSTKIEKHHITSEASHELPLLSHGPPSASVRSWSCWSSESREEESPGCEASSTEIKKASPPAANKQNLHIAPKSLACTADAKGSSIRVWSSPGQVPATPSHVPSSLRRSSSCAGLRLSTHSPKDRGFYATMFQNRNPQNS